jgi:hypothetical protein
MRQIIIATIVTLVATVPCGALEFLNVELCAERVDTGVVLPVDSPLSLESVEIGKYGGLVMLLHSNSSDVLALVDDLMTPYTGARGTGDERKLEWSGNQITAFAQVIKKGYVALAITAADDCVPDPEPVAAVERVEPEAPPTPDAAPAATDEAVIPSVAAVAAPAVAGVAAQEQPPQFELKGRLKHAGAEGDWVDVMGVVVNASGESYIVTSFDLSLYDADGGLICVDTISVNQLRDGQERAFRASIRCADYAADAVAGWKLQFAGAH